MQCTAGSTKLPTAPNYFQFDSVSVGSFLPFPASIAWLGFLGLPTGSIDTAEFCSTEPPDTTLSALDVVQLAIPPLARATGAYDRLANYIQQQAFSTYCTCNNPGGGTATYPAQILGLHPYWYLKLDRTGSTTELDSSGNGRTGNVSTTTGEGAASLITGDSTTSYSTGSGYAFRTSAAAAERWRGSVSSAMEWWGFFTTPGADTPLYDCYGGTNPYLRVQSDTSGHVGLIMRDTAGTTIGPTYSSATYDTSVAHQFDLVLDAAAHTLTLYIDAVSRVQLTGLSTNDYMGAFSHFLHHDNSNNNTLTGRVGQWSWFDNTTLSPGVIADNFAAAGGSQPYTPPVYTPPTDGTPPAGTAPTCSTNQDVCNQLYITDQLLLALSSQIAIAIKQTQPSTWVAGTPSAGLTGTGTISVLGTLGAQLSLTSVPSGWGQTFETPRRLIPAVGSIQLSNGTWNSDSELIHYDSQLIFDSAWWATTIRYNLRPGVVATITPLLAGR